MSAESEPRVRFEGRIYVLSDERWPEYGAPVVVRPRDGEAERLRADLTRLSDLTVDVLHGRRHSGELLRAIKPYRSPSSLDAEAEPA